VDDTAERVVGESGPSSPRLVTAAAEEVPTLSEPTAALKEHVAPEGTTQAASPEIQEAEEDTGTTLLQGAASGQDQSLELACTPWEPLSRLVTTLRTTRR
jgi:hypothetical protein